MQTGPLPGEAHVISGTSVWILNLCTKRYRKELRSAASTKKALNILKENVEILLQTGSLESHI